MKELATAKRLYWEGNVDASTAICHQLIGDHPHLWEAYMLCAQCREVANDRTGKRDITRKCYAKATSIMEKSDLSYEDHAIIARFFFEVRDLPQCLMWLNRATKLNPDSAENIDLLEKCQHICNGVSPLAEATSEMLLRERLDLFPDDKNTEETLQKLLQRHERSGGSDDPHTSVRSMKCHICLYIPDVIFNENATQVNCIRVIFAKLFLALKSSNIAFSIHRQTSYRPILAPDPAYRHLTWHTHGKEANRWHVKDGYLPGYFYLDRGGYSGWAEITECTNIAIQLNCVPSDKAETFHSHLWHRYVEASYSKYDQPAGEAKFPIPYIFVALQIPDDDVMALAYLNTRELLEWAVENFRNSSYTVVVKRHPLCKDPQIELRLRQLGTEKHVVVTDASVHTIIAGSTAVFCVNSGVGFEALLHSKRVFVSGATDYFCVARNIISFQNFETILSLLLEAVDIRRIKAFLYLFLNGYLVNQDDQHEIDARLRMICNGTEGWVDLIARLNTRD